MNFDNPVTLRRLAYLDKIKSHIARKQQELLDAGYELQLLKDSVTTEVNSWRPDIIAYHLDSAASWLHREKGAEADSQMKSMELDYQTVRCEVKRHVGRAVTIQDIIHQGLSHYAWCVHFTVWGLKGPIFSLIIPRYEQLTYDEIVESGWAQYKLQETTQKGYKSVCTAWKEVWSSYDLDELASYFETRLKEDI